MAIQFDAKTEAELEKEEEQRMLEALLPKGTYDFEVFKSEDKKSKAGNPMIEMRLKVFGDDGRTVFVSDWILGAMMFKLKHFCDSTGLTRQYQEGSLCALDCMRATGRVQLEIEPAKDGYPAKNKVVDYGEPEVSDQAPASGEKREGDEIPWGD